MPPPLSSVPVKHGKGLRSESSGKRIRLGSRAFSSKEELFDLFSGFLGSKNPGDIVEGEAADMIIDLIKTAHRHGRPSRTCLVPLEFIGN